MLCVAARRKATNGSIAPTVSAALPSEGGADRDAVHEALEKCNRRAFDLFLLGAVLSKVPYSFSLIRPSEKSLAHRVRPHSADPEHTPPTCTTDAANREAARTRLLSRPKPQ